MSDTRTVGFLVTIVLLAAGGYWLLSGGSAATPSLGGSSISAEPNEQHPNAGSAQGLEEAAERANVPVVATVGATNGVAIIGKVVDESGRPVAKAKVGTGLINVFDPRSFQGSDFNLEDPSKFVDRMRERVQQRVEVETGMDGMFRLVVTGTGNQIQVEARARAFLPAQKSAPRPTSADVDVGTMTLKRGAVIAGRVINAQNQPVVNASVMRRAKDQAATQGQGGGFRMMMGGGQGGGQDFMGGEAMDLMRGMLGDVVTDADGQFEMANEAPGEFSLRVRHAEYPSATREGLSVSVGQTLANLLIVFDMGISIRGRVTAIPDGAKNVRVLAALARANAGAAAQGTDPLASMGTQFMDMMGDFALAAERSAEVAADGSFELQGLSVGQRFRVWVTQGNRGSMAAAVCSQRKEVLSGTTDVELRFDPGVIVTAKIVDAKTSKPIEALFVRDQLEGGGMADLMSSMSSMATRGARGRTYPEGLVTISSLRPKPKQTLKLTIEAIGYKKFEQKGIVLPEQGAVDLGTLSLEPAPVIRIEARTKSGTPVADAAVSLRSQTPQRRGGGGGGGGGLASMMENFTNGDGGGMPGPMGMMMGGFGIGQGKTDAEGRCTMNAIVDGPFTVQVTEKSFAPYVSDAIAPRVDADIEWQVVMLVGGSVLVRMFDGEDKPVADARIEHAPPAGQNDTKPGDASGVAEFAHLIPGAHRFRIASGTGGGAQGMFAGRGNRGASAVPEAEWQSIDVVDGAQAELTLSKAATATLTGLLRENGVPLAGARVQFVAGDQDDAASNGANRDPAAMAMEMFQQGSARSERTEDQGRYTLKDLKPGQHRVRVTVTGRSMPTTVRVFLRLGQNVQDIDLDTSSLRGVVVDPTGKPVAGASVRVTAANDTTPSLDGIMQGLNFGGRGGRLGQALGGGNSATSEADGRFELKGVQTGVSLLVRATAKGFAGGESQPVEAAAGSVRDGIQVKLISGGTIRVAAVSDQPFAAVSATMEGDGAKGISPAFALLSNGSATLEGLRPGTWRVSMRTGFGGGGGGGGRGGRAGAAGGGAVATEGVVVTVVAGETVDVTL